MEIKVGDVLLAFITFEGEKNGKVRPLWVLQQADDGTFLGVPGYSQHAKRGCELPWEVLADPAVLPECGLHKGTLFDFRNFGRVVLMQNPRVIGRILRQRQLGQAAAAYKAAREHWPRKAK